MRVDVKSLLNRLGKTDFAYREFEDRFADLELWPMLEALLRDPRLRALGEMPTHDAAARPSPAMVAETRGALFPLSQDWDHRTLADLVSTVVAHQTRSPADAQADNADVRSLLQQLSGQGVE